MKKKFLVILFNVLFLFSLNVLVHAATVTWTGGGSDNLASSSASWSGGVIPQNGDKVVFDSTSTRDCIWNLSVVISSFTIKSGYTGKVTKIAGTSITVAKVKRWTGGGADELASNPANWSDNIVPQNGDRIVFDESSPKNCTWNIGVTPTFLSMTGYTGMITLNNDLTIAGSLTTASGTLNLNNWNLNVDGYVLIISSGTLNATSSTITVKGNWANYGNFYPGTSTVILSGTNQNIYGNTTFYNLIKTVTSADTLYFEAGSTQTIINSLTLQGASNNLLSLRSTVDGSFWYIDPEGARNISFMDLKDSYNKNFTRIILLPDSVDSGNNTGVSFGGNECVCRVDWRWRC